MSATGDEFFNPGAKYHSLANTPYAKYFLSFVLQFQFHRALAKTAGCTTPLHHCSIYGNADAESGSGRRRDERGSVRGRARWKR